MANIKTNKCRDCNKLIHKISIRCHSCANKNRKGNYHMKNSHWGKESNNWKGNKVKISPLHEWIRRHKPKPKLCEDCKKIPPYDLSNISGKYKRDINDFEWLCRKCHMKKDGRLDYFKKYIGQNKPKCKKKRSK